MEIQREDNGQYGEFFIEENNDRVAFLAFRWVEDVLTLDHTEVDEKLSGRGIGKQLVTAAVEYAREKKVKINPLCSYAHALFEKIKDFADVRA
jgi:predicted GNAT family acetyltransferase